MGRLLLYTVLTLFLTFSCKEGKEPNSVLAKAYAPQDSILSLLDQYKDKTHPDRKLLLTKACSIAEREGLDSLWLVSTHKLSNVIYREGDYQTFKKLSSVYLTTAQEVGDSLHLARAHYKLGSFYFKFFVYDSAFFYFNKAKELFVNQKDSLQVGSNLLNMSIIQTNVGDYYGSESTAIEALDYLKFEGNTKYLAAVYNNLGIVSNELKQYQDALFWYEQCKPYTRNSKERIVLLNNIGIVHRNMEKYKAALVSFNEARRQVDIAQYPLVEAMVLDNIGYTRFLGNEKGAFSIMQRAYIIRQKKKSTNGSIVSQLHLGAFFAATGEQRKAIDYFEEAYRGARSIGDVKNTLKALLLLSQNTADRIYLKEYNKLQDSVIENERILKHEFARIKYRTNEKERQNFILQQKNATQMVTVEKQKRSAQLLTTTIVLLAILLIAGALYYRQRQRLQKQNIAIATLKARADEQDLLAMFLHEDISSDILNGLQRGDRLQKTAYHGEWEKVLLLFEQAYSKVRKISQKMSVQHFGIISFKKKVTSLCQQVHLNTDLQIDISGLDLVEWKLAPEEIKVAIYGILQESLNNVQKHAKASMVKIVFALEGKYLMLQIEDDGIGYVHNVHEGIGLLHMRKRVKEMNGSFRIEKRVPSGTTIKINISKYW
ncbi:MAG: ATP-binding protein [Bacteroidota bacterium]